MLPVLFLVVVTAIAAFVIGLTCRQDWLRAVLIAAAGTLGGAVVGAAFGGLIDVARAQGDALLPAAAIGAVLGAVVATAYSWLTRAGGAKGSR